MPLNQAKQFTVEEFYPSANDHLKPYLLIIPNLPLKAVTYYRNGDQLKIADPLFKGVSCRFS